MSVVVFIIIGIIFIIGGRFIFKKAMDSNNDDEAEIYLSIALWCILNILNIIGSILISIFSRGYSIFIIMRDDWSFFFLFLIFDSIIVLVDYIIRLNDRLIRS